MWKIKTTIKKVSIKIELFPLFTAVKMYEGIFLFSSQVLGGKNIIGLNPIIKVKKESLHYDNRKEHIKNPFKVIDTIITEGSKTGNTKGIGAGFLGYIAYDYKDQLEEAQLYKNPRQGMLPDLYFALFEHYLIFKTGNKKVTLISLEPFFQYKSIQIEHILRIISQPLAISFNNKKSSYSGTSLPKQKYEAAVKKTIEYIKAGDIYQANITRAIYGETGFTPEELGYRLYHSNRIEFGIFANIEDTYVISTSPERFFKVQQNKILTSPIKGTINKTDNRNINKMNIKKLITSEKDLAELAMIVDLLRNDISKICMQGTVKVKGFPILKELYNVYHLVADIEGTLFKGITFEDIIRAMFPGGSISGCPKIRACQIIEELEKEGRGLYTGSFGYYTFEKKMDFNIMIRSLFLKGSSFVFNVGGGITLLSDPEKEYEETIYKAKNIWDALHMEDVWEERYCLVTKKPF